MRARGAMPLLPGMPQRAVHDLPASHSDAWPGLRSHMPFHPDALICTLSFARSHLHALIRTLSFARSHSHALIRTHGQGCAHTCLPFGHSHLHAFICMLSFGRSHSEAWPGLRSHMPFIRTLAFACSHLHALICTLAFGRMASPALTHAFCTNAYQVVATHQDSLWILTLHQDHILRTQRQSQRWANIAVAIRPRTHAYTHMHTHRHCCTVSSGRARGQAAPHSCAMAAQKPGVWPYSEASQPWRLRGRLWGWPNSTLSLASRHCLQSAYN